MNEPLVSDEQPVEEGLREILAPLDSQLARVSSFLPLGLVTLVPIAFFTFWLVVELSGRRSLVLAGGALCALVAIYLAWELAVSRMARARFDRRFPAGTPARAVALRMLFEMETPSKAEDKLRVALASASPDRIVRRRPAVGTDTSSWTPPTQAELPSPATLSALEPHPTPRPGGYYDYIPLEPRAGDADPTGERKV